MSSPIENTSSEHPSSPENLFDYPITIDELVHVLKNEEGRERLLAVFENDTTGNIVLRMFASLSNQIELLERQAANLRIERNSVYNFGMTNPRFQQEATRLIYLNRQQQGDPHLLTPPTLYQPTQTTSSNSPLLQSESSPRSVEIHLEEANAIQEDQIESDPSPQSSPRSIIIQPEEIITTAYHTADENEPGSSTNPIQSMSTRFSNKFAWNDEDSTLHTPLSES